jgi:mRNA-degrading endonuclease RelE of RelBE toxin-antitoxin system
LNYYFKPSFSRLFKKLDPLKQKPALEAIEALKTLLESNVRLEGLGLKRLGEDLWEIRTSLKDRILFTFKKDTVTFVMIGNHDDVVRYLKHF